MPTVVGTIVYLRYTPWLRGEWQGLIVGNLGVVGVLLLVARVVGFELVRCQGPPTPHAFWQSKPLTVGNALRGVPGGESTSVSLSGTARRPFPTEEITELDRQNQLGRFQFTIRDMLLWMTGLAVILGALHYMPEGRSIFTIYPLEGAIVVFGSFLLVAAASIVLSLCNGWLLARLLLLPLTIGLSGALLASHFIGLSLWYYSLLFGLMSVWVTASLLVVRYAGYRLTWRWRFSRKQLDGRDPGRPPSLAG